MGVGTVIDAPPGARAQGVAGGASWSQGSAGWWDIGGASKARGTTVELPATVLLRVPGPVEQQAASLARAVPQDRVTLSEAARRALADPAGAAAASPEPAEDAPAATPAPSRQAPTRVDIVA